MTIKSIRAAPGRMLTSMALWWLDALPPAPPYKPPFELPVCSICFQRNPVYRKYADNHVECMACWPGGRG
jgi:hypothetical protein